MFRAKNSDLHGGEMNCENFKHRIDTINTVPQGMRKFKPVEYSKTQGVWNEADGETRCQQQELLGNREGLPVLV